MNRTIGVLTSGGDAPGMNPAIRSVVRTAIQQGCRVIGINNGYDGIFDGNIEEMGSRLLSGMIDRGGTILQSSRCKRMYTPEGVCDAETFIGRMKKEVPGGEFEQEIRKTVLGHVQRGGIPTHFDRMLGARFGELAVLGLLQQESGCMTSLSKGRTTLVDFDKVIGKKKHPAPELVRLARNLQIDFGDPTEV